MLMSSHSRGLLSSPIPPRSTSELFISRHHYALLRLHSIASAVSPRFADDGQDHPASLLAGTAAPSLAVYP